MNKNKISFVKIILVTYLLVISFIIISEATSTTPSPQKHFPQELDSFINLSNVTGAFIQKDSILSSERLVIVGKDYNFKTYYMNVSLKINSDSTSTKADTTLTISCCKKEDGLIGCRTTTTTNEKLTTLNCNQYSTYPLEIKVVSASSGLIVYLTRDYTIDSSQYKETGESFTIPWN